MLFAWEAILNHLPVLFIVMLMMFLFAPSFRLWEYWREDDEDPSCSGAADDLLDPVIEPGDASVDAVQVWTPAAFAPANHSGQEPATRRLLANQGTTRVSLTERGNVKRARGTVLMSLEHKMTIIIDKSDDHHWWLNYDIIKCLDVWLFNSFYGL